MIQDIFNGPIVMFVALDLCMIWALCPEKYIDRSAGRITKSVLASLAVAAVALVLVYFLVDSDNASTAIQGPLCILLMTLLAHFAQRQSWRISLYCAVWAQLLTDIVSQSAYPLGRRACALFGADFSIMEPIIIVVACVLIFLVGKLFLARNLQQNGDYTMNQRKLFTACFFCAAFLVLGNYQFIYFLLGDDTEVRKSAMVEVFRLLVGLLCATALFLQNDAEKRQAAQQDLAIVRQLAQQHEEQYRLSQENIDLINRKCHDLKRQISALRFLKDSGEFQRQLEEMEHAVGIYDSAIKTGNKVLDVVFTEKMLFCEAHGINMTCLVDGHKLDFVNETDLYTMLSNILDNAIESVMAQPDREKRIIQVAGYEEQQFLLLRVRNYCDTPPELVDGLPVTTKADKELHGFGLKSIQFTAQKYNGDIHIRTDSNSFTIEVLLPLPQQAEAGWPQAAGAE